MPNITSTSTRWLGSEFELTTFTSTIAGPRLLLLGAVHGNETCGPAALGKARDAIVSGEIALGAGSVTLIPICNPKAYIENKRYVDWDLNRDLRKRDTPRCYEHFVGNALLDVLADHDVLLDIHSFRPAGSSFLFLGPENNVGPIEPFDKAEAELDFAQSLGFSRCAFGWLRAYSEFVVKQREYLTSHNRQASDQAEQSNEYAEPSDIGLGRGVTENFRRLGGYGVTIECGQHEDPSCPLIAYRAIKSAIDYVSSLPCGKPGPERTPFRETFRFKEIMIKEDRGDRLHDDWQLFHAFQKGERLGTRASGELVYPDYDGAVIFSYPDCKVGGAWIYLAELHPRGAGASVSA